MTKGYINRWKPRKDPDENLIDYWFCEYAKDAAYWPTQELTEIDAMHFNRGITIPSSLGGSYTIVDFHVEEFSPDHFVIFAHSPFIVSEPGASNVKHQCPIAHIAMTPIHAPRSLVSSGLQLPNPLRLASDLESPL